MLDVNEPSDAWCFLRAYLLVPETDKLTAILSEWNTSVKEIINHEVVYVRPEQSTEEWMTLMTDKRTRHLPVLKGNQLIGIISIGDVIKAIISE